MARANCAASHTVQPLPSLQPPRSLNNDDRYVIDEGGRERIWFARRGVTMKERERDRGSMR